MQTRKIVSLLILVLAVLTIAGSCATKQKTISEEDLLNVIQGTWINTEYEDDVRPVKYVIYNNGTYEWYVTETITRSKCKGTITILDKWVDSEGNSWYTNSFFCEVHRHECYEINKISNTGDIRELLFTCSKELTIEDWQPDNFKYDYRIYYRQE